MSKLVWHSMTDKCKKTMPHKPECSKGTSIQPKKDAMHFAKKYQATVYVDWNTPKQFLVTADGEVQL